MPERGESRRPSVHPTPLAPGLLLPPGLRPRHDLTPIPQAALSLATDRRGEVRPANDHGRAQVGHAEEFGELDETDWPWLRHGSEARSWRHSSRKTYLPRSIRSRCEDAGFIPESPETNGHPPVGHRQLQEVLRGMKFILSACRIHRGCTIQVVFGKTSGRRAPWPDPDLKPIGEREFPGLVLIEAEHLRNQRSAVANQNLDRLGRWLLRLHLHE